MCRLLALSSTRRLSLRRIHQATRLASKIMRDQSDGFGFAVASLDNSPPYIERHALPESFAGVGRAAQAQAALLPCLYEPTSATSGTLSPQHRGAVLFHGRTATNAVGIENTHPFTKNAWTLAHNGVVQWEGEARQLDSTCDSEHLLNCFALGSGLSDFKSLTGWAAWLALAPDGSLRAGRDSRTPLHVAWCASLASYIIGTTRADIAALTKGLGVRVTDALAMPDNTEFRFGAGGHDDVNATRHEGLAARASLASLASVALGQDRRENGVIWRTAARTQDVLPLSHDAQSIAAWELENFHNSL